MRDVGHALIQPGDVPFHPCDVPSNALAPAKVPSQKGEFVCVAVDEVENVWLV